MKNAIFVFLAFVLPVLSSYSQTMSECPFNAINCAYGCGRHIDLNDDGYCDHSVLELSMDSLLKISQDTIGEDSSVTKKNIEKFDKKVDAKDGESFRHDDSDSSLLTQETDTAITIIDEDQPEPKEVVVKQASPRKIYDLLEISVLTLFLYLLSFFLSKRNIIRRVIHRRIWNALLLITFLVSCLFGFWLVIMINYKIAMETFRTFLFWHVEVGIAMTLISVFHILWHLKYFKNIFNKPCKPSKL